MRNFSVLSKRLRILFGVALLVLIFGGGSAVAAIYTVTKFVDTNDNVCDADCSLREAVLAANANSAEANTIILQTGTYILSIDGLENNSAAGDLDITGQLTISGAGAENTRIDAAGINDRIFEVRPGADLRVSGVSVINGSSSHHGGGIYCSQGTLSLEETVIRNNTASDSAEGGGIYAQECIVTISSSEIRENTARSGGGLEVRDSVFSMTYSAVADNSASATDGAGGGIQVLIFSTDEISIEISFSNIYGNSANVGGGAFFGGSGATSGTVNISNTLVAENSANSSGAGLRITDKILSAQLENSTISSNNTPGLGGGINTDAYTIIRHCTITDNTAGTAGNSFSGGGGLFAYLGEADVRLQHTILTGNLDRNDGSRDDCYKWGLAQTSSEGYSLLGNVGNCTFAGTGDIMGEDPLLGPLQNNGGSTRSHALLPDSPALDAGDPAFVTPPPYDQRGVGFPRVSNGRIDIGAYEFKPSSILYLLPPMVRDRDSGLNN